MRVNDNWSQLSLKQKADLFKIYAANGYTSLDDIVNHYNNFASGGPISIKPSHRGRLTELKEKTGKSEAELYNDGNPAHKKMVVFARNARKWKHDDGGYLDNLTVKPFSYTPIPQVRYADGGTLQPAILYANPSNLIQKGLNKISNYYWHKLSAPKDFSKETTDLDECAKYSNNRVGEIVGKRPYGDAWTRSSNNVEKIISGYDALDRPTEYDERKVLDYLYSAADNVKKNIKLKELKEGDIVGMFFRNSPNLEKAYNKGSNNEAQTHTGHIVMRHNKPYVEHNVHGDIKLNKVKDVLGKNNPYGIVSVYRMKSQGGPIEDTPIYIDKYDRISNERYNTALSTINSIIEDSARADILARILSAQSIAETGWVDNNDSNNYGGYKANGKIMKFESPEAFWEYHINNLDTKWSNWRGAVDLNDYLRIVNNSDLGLTTKELFDTYNKEHKENPAYIYAPVWENPNYEGLVRSVGKRASKYLSTE